MPRAKKHHVPKQPRPSSTSRGYGAEHKKLRESWLKRMEAGERPTCVRCSRPVSPDEPWDLGHNDADRRFYNGPEHAACNRAVSAHLAAWQAVLDAQAPQPPF